MENNIISTYVTTSYYRANMLFLVNIYNCATSLHGKSYDKCLYNYHKLPGKHKSALVMFGKSTYKDQGKNSVTKTALHRPKEVKAKRTKAKTKTSEKVKADKDEAWGQPAAHCRIPCTP